LGFINQGQVKYATDQFVKDISLVNMNRDESFIFGSFDFGQVLGCHIDQCIEQVEKRLICSLHDLAVIFRIRQGFCSVACPKHLQTQNTNLRKTNGLQTMIVIITEWLLHKSPSR